MITLVITPKYTWYCRLTPPSDYELDNVQATLVGTIGKTTTVFPPAVTATPAPVIPTLKTITPTPAPPSKSGKRLAEGSIFSGVVSGVKSFGAFIDLCDGVTGLCHIGEWGHSFITDMNRATKIGDKVNVMLLKVTDEGKLNLSRKCALECPSDSVINAKEEIQQFKGIPNFLAPYTCGASPKI
jgi:predicted RNA-binding protein with RPS1 domain